MTKLEPKQSMWMECLMLFDALMLLESTVGAKVLSVIVIQFLDVCELT